MILSYQDIATRCFKAMPDTLYSSEFLAHVDRCAARDANGKPMPMITPFHPDKIVVNGKSHGCSSNSYDVCIDHDLVLGPLPGTVALEMLHVLAYGSGKFEKDRAWLQARLANVKPHTALAYTVEDFYMPTDVCATVVDKSSYARVFVSAFNTMMDAGFQGNLTLELVNFSDKEVVYKKGDPVCQLMFHQLTSPTLRPYNGKYMHQSKAAHPARYEQSRTTDDAKSS